MDFTERGTGAFTFRLSCVLRRPQRARAESSILDDRIVADSESPKRLIAAGNRGPLTVVTGRSNEDEAGHWPRLPKDQVAEAFDFCQQ